MAGYTIHLAIGKVYERYNEIKDIVNFERGIIEPDLVDDKSKTHYGLRSSETDLNKCLKEKEIVNDFDEGFLLHLVTDYLFYKNFLKNWNRTILLCNDYDILNEGIIKKYGIILPEIIKDTVKIKKGNLSFLNKEEVYKFIDTIGKINIREMIKQRDIDFQNEISKIQF